MEKSISEVSPTSPDINQCKQEESPEEPPLECPADHQSQRPKVKREVAVTESTEPKDEREELPMF
jgi:hypothetical protein